MAKHHPDLIFCRKQAGVGMYDVVQYIYLFFSFGRIYMDFSLVFLIARSHQAG